MTDAVERQLNDPTICQVCGQKLGDPKDIARIAVLNSIIETQQAIIDDLRNRFERLQAALTETLDGYVETQYYDQEIVDRARAVLAPSPHLETR